MTRLSYRQHIENRGIDVSTNRDERILRENGWIVEINKGSQQAFEQLYRYYYPKLGHFLFRYVYSQETVEDLLHNIFFSVWENRANIEPYGTLRTYLYRTARNHALNYLKRHKNHTVLISEVQDTPGMELNRDETIEYKEFRQAVHMAVSEIPEKRRRIFLMHREDHLTYSEIANVLDISIKTVETQMDRSLKFLQFRLAHFIK